VAVWIDAQLSPALAAWVTQTFNIPAAAVRELGMRDAVDQEIFEAARKAKATVLTKDSDFVHLLERFGPPPHVIWLTCGNTSNAYLRQILTRALPEALTLLKSGECLVEISDPW